MREAKLRRMASAVDRVRMVKPDRSPIIDMSKSSFHLNNVVNQVPVPTPSQTTLIIANVLATSGKGKHLGTCFTQFHQHAWATIPAFYAGMCQFTKADFCRKAIEMRAVRQDILFRISQCGGNETLKAYLNFQLLCLPPQLDLMDTLPTSVPNHQVHLGGLSHYDGDTEMRGEVHTVRVDNTLIRYRDQAYPRSRPLANMNALMYYESATRLMARLPATTTLAEAQHRFKDMLNESDSGSDGGSMDSE